MYSNTPLVQSIVLSDVAGPVTISTRGARWAGLPHLVTTTLSGRLVEVASWLTLKDEPVLARTARFGQWRSSSASTVRLSSRSSAIASTAKPTCPWPLRRTGWVRVLGAAGRASPSCRSTTPCSSRSPRALRTSSSARSQNLARRLNEYDFESAEREGQRNPPALIPRADHCGVANWLYASVWHLGFPASVAAAAS